MAYSSLVCLTNILEQNLHLNLIPHISQHIETLIQEASYFQDFIEKFSWKSGEKVKYLETRIRDAAYKAQDLIDSHIANQLDNRGTSLASNLFEGLEIKDQFLDEVMAEINSIKQEVMWLEENEEENEDNSDEPDLQPRNSLSARSLRPPSHGMSTMIGLDDDFKQIKTRLGSGSLQLEIVALVGMGGIGKTTLAKKIYIDESIHSHFDTHRWVTVSQKYSMQSIISRLLCREESSQENNEKLGLGLYQSLKNRRYLIVLDDMWDTKIGDGLKRVLPNDENGSRILLTTRLEQVAKHENSCPLHHVRFLNDKESWDLFSEEVFRGDCCPPEMEKIGKRMVQNCQGFPLAVKVIGGHLSKTKRTEQYWRSVAKNLSETIVSSEDELVLKVLYLSYKHLPNHLKGCFLYMGIFPEDYEIEVPVLMHLWIASGLINQEQSKSSKDIYKEYLLDLIERNLILVSERKYNGKITLCKIHDLVKDLCVKEAKNEIFFHVSDKTLFGALGYPQHQHNLDINLLSSSLKALHMYRRCIDIPRTMVNLRYLYYLPSGSGTEIYISKRTFVHLQTIFIGNCPLTLEIWEMTQLRHVMSREVLLTLPDPSATQIVLEKMQTLYTVENFVFTDEVLQRIPNIKKLGLWYPTATDWRDFGLDILERLQKLESLKCSFAGLTQVVLRRDITFPSSIKKLALFGCLIPWKDMTVIGSLPNLEVLKLGYKSFVGEEWEPNEGEFLNLKTLLLDYIDDLVHWRAEAIHFPELQHLFIKYSLELQEIPSGFGESTTLQLMEVKRCKESVYSSAKQIEEEQHDFGNEGFQVIITK